MEKTIRRALYALTRTDDQSFVSKGKNRVLTISLPHDKNVRQLAVAGVPIFSIHYPMFGTHAEFRVENTNTPDMTPDERQLTAQAFRVMFELLGRSDFSASLNPHGECQILKRNLLDGEMTPVRDVPVLPLDLEIFNPRLNHYLVSGLQKPSSPSL